MKFSGLRPNGRARLAATAVINSAETGISAEAGDRLGLYPAERDVPPLEGRRYLWIARAFAIGMFLSLCLNVVLGMAIAALAPLVRVEPMLLTFKDRSEQIVKIEPFQRGTAGFELMTEMLVRDYVLSRHEVVLDENEMRRRWGGHGIVAFRSSPDEYARFVGETAPRFEALRQTRLVRTVNVHRVSKIADGYWQVAFTTHDMSEGVGKIGEERWVASLTVAYVAREVNWEDRYMNPLGFIVTDYAVVAER
jgi:type IV secretion system protein VirB8